MEKGKVYLAGSGPGDPGLITVKAKELLESADVVIYDNLINEMILAGCRENCEKIYVGKSGSHHTLEQDAINELICEKANEGKMVVRLKGGDPFVFGRGGEEAICLNEKGIPFEVVNGVSSAYAVPAYAGIPVTHRGAASAVAFITGHEDPTKEQSHIDWQALASGKMTLVFLMGVKNLPLITSELRKHGMVSSTPVAVIQNGTYPAQKTVTGTLEDIHEKANMEGIKPPSIIVIGDVVSLREQLYWFEKRPLHGKKIVVTRSREQASELVRRLASLGAEVIETPVLKIGPPENINDLKTAIERINDYDWIIFTSVNGVEYFFMTMHDLGHDTRYLAAVKICAIGVATGDRLKSCGILADLVPEKYISTSIVDALDDSGQIKGKKFLLPRADIAPESLQDMLLEKGATQVDNIIAYRTIEEKVENDPYKQDLLKKMDFDLVTFTSSSTVRNFSKILSDLQVNGEDSLTCAAIGPVTAQTAREYGFNVAVEASVHSIDGLIDALTEYFLSSC